MKNANNTVTLNGKKIREYGIARLSREANISYRTLQSYTNGERSPWKMTIQTAKILNKFGLEIEDWFRDESGEAMNGWVK